MRQTTYKDDLGRKWAVLLPDGVPDEAAAQGIPIGPPPLDSLGLSLDVEVRLHNQLFERRLFTNRDALARRTDVLGAVQAAFKMSMQAVLLVYSEAEEVKEPVIASPPPTRRRKKEAITTL